MVDHVSGEVQPPSTNSPRRNMREEAARITGQQVESMDKLKAKNFDVLFVTGGRGVNQGLTDFAEKHEDMKVDDDVEIIILDFFSQ